MKNMIKIYLLSFIFIATPLIAMDGIAVIDMRTAVLSTQAAADAFKALEDCPVFFILNSKRCRFSETKVVHINNNKRLKVVFIVTA